MSVIYSRRAIRDLDDIAAYHRRVAGPKIAEAIGERIEAVINRVAGPSVERAARGAAARRAGGAGASLSIQDFLSPPWR